MSQIDNNPNGPYITGISFEDEWVIVTFQEPVSSETPLVVTDVQKRIRRDQVAAMVADLVVGVNDLLDESARFEHGPPSPDRIRALAE